MSHSSVAGFGRGRLVGILGTMDVLRAVMERVLMPHTQLVD